MNIREIRPESGPGSAAPIQPVRGVDSRDAARTAPERDRDDMVEISDEARALAARDELAAEGSLDAERVLALRRWIQAGGYDAPEVVDRIARRLLELGEV
jgi:anti-sigma28 factor (negative regulator of flagellin synthesis)